MVQGLGAGLPNKAIQVSTLLKGEICLCDTNHNQTLINLKKAFSANTNEGSILATNIITDWFYLEPKQDNWLYNPWLLSKDHLMEIEVTGGSLHTTQVDLIFRVFHGNKEKHISKFVNVPAEGSQCASFVVRSEITVQQVGPQRFKISKRPASYMR